jgi:hypothetical protein
VKIAVWTLVSVIVATEVIVPICTVVSAAGEAQVIEGLAMLSAVDIWVVAALVVKAQ